MREDNEMESNHSSCFSVFDTLVCPIGIFAAFGWNAKVPIPP
jgi:hypothetical protein